MIHMIHGYRFVLSTWQVVWKIPFSEHSHPPSVFDSKDTLGYSTRGSQEAGLPVFLLDHTFVAPHTLDDMPKHYLWRRYS